MKRISIVAFMAVLIFAVSSVNAEVYKQVRINFPDSSTAIRILELGLEPIYSKPGDYADFALDERDMGEFQTLHIPYTIIYDDITAFYQSRNPLGTTMGGYYTFPEMVAIMDSFATNYPNLCGSKFSVATTEGGRSVWVFKISDNVSSNEPEPEVFINSLIHAREPIGGQITIEFARWLLTGYGSDTLATRIINDYQLYLMPCLNPDGYEYNRQTNPSGGGMWRKNRRNNWDGNYGVDLNRNWRYFWGYDDAGSSPSTWDETYRGPSANSEPEIAGTQNFINSHDFAMIVNYHAYGQHFQYPWGYYQAHSDDHSYYFDTLAVYSRNQGFEIGTAWELLYPVNGESVDFDYGDDRFRRPSLGILFEIGTDGDGFWPTQQRITPLVTQSLGILRDLIPRAYDVYKRRLPPLAAITSPTMAPPGAQFYLKWQKPVSDTFNLPVSYRVIEKTGYGRTYQTFEGTVGYIMDGFTRSSARTHGGNYSAYSGQGNNLRRYVTISDRVRVETGMNLTFWAWYNMQADYDYAYVQVSNDGGITWHEIDGSLSTSSNPHRHNKGFGITGSSNNAWVQGTYWLYNYVGQEVKIRIAYWSDPSTSNEGIYIDDVYPWESYAQSTVLAETVNPESLLVGPYTMGAKYFFVQSRDDRGHISDPSNRFAVDISGNMYALNGNVALSDNPGSLAGSLVSIPAASLVDTTDVSGNYSFAAVPQGSYNIIASHPGYYPDTVYAFPVNADSTLNFTLSPAPPGQPTLIAPSNNATLDSAYVNFNWDDTPFASSYVLEIATDVNFTSVILFDSSLTASAYRNAQPFVNGSYYWRVTAHNSIGYSPRSASWRYTINVVVQTPVLVNPPDNFLTNLNNVNFDWNDVPGAISYVIEVAADSLFNNRVTNDSAVVNSGYAHAYNDGYYFWRVTACNGMLYSQRSQVRRFWIVTSLAMPTLLNPADGFVSDSNRIDFSWITVPNANRYILEIARDSAFTDYFLADSSRVQPNLTQAGPLTDDIYFWRVTATNGQIYSPRSETRDFTVYLLLAPALVSPIDGYISASAFVAFDWSDATHAIAYQFQLARDLNFTDIVIDQPALAVSSYTNTDSLGNGEYYWRVRAADGSRWSPYSNSRVVGIDVAPGYLPGDANGSGIVNGIDVIFLVNYLKGGQAPDPMLNGDANGTCNVNGLDVVYLVNYFKGGPEPFRGNCLTRIVAADGARE